MKKKYIRLIKVCILILVMAPLYQNCGRLKSDEVSGGNNVQGSRGDFPLNIFDPAFVKLDETVALTIKSKTQYNMIVDTSNLAGAVLFWDQINYGVSCDLNVLPSLDTAILECFDGGRVGIRVTALFANGSEMFSDLDLFVFDSGVVIPGSNIPVIEIVIESSESASNWNTTARDAFRNNTVLAYLLQPIRLVNDDDVLHQPGGIGDIPCAASPVPLQKGQAYNCIPNVEILVADAPIYDLLDPGPGPVPQGRFNLRVIDSKRIFTSKQCLSCHALRVGDSINDLRYKLAVAIENVPAMSIYDVTGTGGAFNSTQALSATTFNIDNPNNTETLNKEEFDAIVFYMYYIPN